MDREVEEFEGCRVLESCGQGFRILVGQVCRVWSDSVDGHLEVALFVPVRVADGMGGRRSEV